jgi:putative transposase
MAAKRPRFKISFVALVTQTSERQGLRYNYNGTPEILKWSGAVSRLRRLFLSDCYFFVTYNLSRERSLLGETDFASLAESIASARTAHPFLLTAWVFLPDHWHGIVYPPYPLTISRVLKSIKLISTPFINRLPRELGQLWQGRFFDHALRTVRKYHECINYIHQNPVRRALVERPEQWKWSSVHSYLGRHQAFLPIDRVQLPTNSETRLISG